MILYFRAWATTVIIVVLAASASPASAQSQAESQAKEQKIACANNLKMIGYGFLIWAGDNKDRYPFNMSAKEGGTLEFCARGTNGVDQNAWKHFQVMSNELNDAKILVCPADKTKQVTTNFPTLGSSNVSYTIYSGPLKDLKHPRSILVRCPIHGIQVLCDGSLAVEPSLKR